MTRINLVTEREPGVWSRLMLRAKRAHSMTNDKSASALRWAVDAMALEQREDGISRGVLMCDIPWCSCAASHRWILTAKQLKGARRKYKGQAIEAAPVSTLCARHIGRTERPNFVPLVADVPVAA